MTEIIILLAAFGIKHFICDFLLQFNNMIREKGTYGAKGGIYHAGLHGWFTLIILFPFYPSIAIQAAVIDTVAHYHIDWTKQQFTKKLTPADRNFWVWLGLDQCLHYLTYIAIIGWAVDAFKIN